MSFVRALSILSFSAALAAPAFAQDFSVLRDPVGESAHFVLDRASSRTTSLIREGDIVTSVPRAVEDAEGKPAYEVKLDYDLNITFIGRKKGSQSMNVDAAFFTPEFMEQLRESKEYVGPSFKMRHLGYADATTLDGQSYEHCDKIMIYDVKLGVDGAPFANLAASLLASAVDPSALGIDFQDLKITAHVTEGLPVFGAVKIDLSGKYSGISIKAGADYKAN